MRKDGAFFEGTRPLAGACDSLRAVAAVFPVMWRSPKISDSKS